MPWLLLLTWFVGQHYVSLLLGKLLLPFSTIVIVFYWMLEFDLNSLNLVVILGLVLKTLYICWMLPTLSSFILKGMTVKSHRNADSKLLIGNIADNNINKHGVSTKLVSILLACHKNNLLLSNKSSSMVYHG